MKLSISKLRQIIQEEVKEELLEKKKGEEKFSPSQTPAEADATFSQCMKDAEVDPDPGVSEEEAKARICTVTRKTSGASLDHSEKYKDHLKKIRKGGEE
jgi:hypothetical protein|tara:strand:- start:3237 stop:3533 length:297 start_codon:yes stop_codon:yes gene_type:complete